MMLVSDTSTSYVEERTMINIGTMRARRSVRTFTEESVASELIEKLSAYMKELDNPFHIPIEFQILDAKEYKVSSPVLVGAQTYIVGKYQRQPNAELAFGYEFEKLMLCAVSLGLGTVWIAGTMDRKAFERAIEVKDGEVMPAITPIGYAANKKSIREGMMRKAIKADERMDFEKLFFDRNFEHPLKEADAGRFLLPLQMVRWAPSATNKQPWRLVVDGNRIHFYEEKTKGYDREEIGDVQKIDLGIAMAHFEIAANETGQKGRFVQANPKLMLPENTEYITTFEL